MFTWKHWIDMTKLGFEAQCVIALRLAKVAAGGAAAKAECRRMVTEKVSAAIEAQAAAAAALTRGKNMEAAAALALVPVRRTVRANRRRLSRAQHVENMMLPLRRLARQTGRLPDKS
jgi:hypothetical protein